MGWKDWGRRITIGHDDDTIIALGLLGIINDTLKVSATSSEYLYLARCFFDALHFTCHTVELHHIDVLNAIMEETVDDRIKVG